MLFDESDILDTLAELETLKEEVERTMFRLPSLTKLLRTKDLSQPDARGSEMPLRSRMSIK